MQLWRQVRPRMLWNISTAVQVTNARSGFFAGGGGSTNPVQVPEGVTAAVFQVTITNTNRALTAARIFGGLRNAGFPTVGSTTEVIASWGTFNGAGLVGKLRGPQPNTANAVRVNALDVFPSWLMLEISTSAIAQNDLTCAAVVMVTFLGPPITGVS